VRIDYDNPALDTPYAHAIVEGIYRAKDVYLPGIGYTSRYAAGDFVYGGTVDPVTKDRRRRKAKAARRARRFNRR
jgi:hypothetical protein